MFSTIEWDGFLAVPENIPEERQGLYGILCLPTGKWYIGISRNILNRSIDHRKKRSRHKIKKAIAKHGPESFLFVPLLYTTTGDFRWLADVERDAISLFDSVRNGYNILLASDGAGSYGEEHSKLLKIAFSSPMTREKKRASSQESWLDPAVRKRRVDGLSRRWKDPKFRETMRLARIDILYTPERRQAISDRQTGHVVKSTTREKISASLMGRVRPPEVREKIRSAMVGREQGVETRKKIGAAISAAQLAGKYDHLSGPSGVLSNNQKKSTEIRRARRDAGGKY